MSESKVDQSGIDSSTARDDGSAKTTEHVTAASALEDAPDPDEDDLDDLDDMLDEFSTVKLDATKPQSASGPGRPPSDPLTTTAPAASAVPALDPAGILAAEDENFSEDEFQKQLQAGMEELMGDLDKNVSLNPRRAQQNTLMTSDISQPEMQAQFESIFKELGEAAALGAEPLPEASTSQPPPSSSKPAGTRTTADAGRVAEDLSTNATFQDTIRRTMARMQASGDQATAAAAAEGSEDDFIAEMMKTMKDLPAGEGSEEDFTKMLMGMMEQLTNKEILYEPMRELNEKFPDWMEKNRSTLKPEDLKRYEEQQTYVKEMVAKFEESTYKDSNAADREYIVDRMQKVSRQAALLCI